METILNLDVIRAASLREHPYDYLIESNFIRSDKIAALHASFPVIQLTGFHPAHGLQLEGVFKQFIAELEGDALTQVLSEKFGQDFTPYPKLVTIRKLSSQHEGRIHADSTRKIMSLLLYLNDRWEHKTGKLRVLHNAHDITDYAAEISPQTGSVFAFIRADHSWHGHEPFTGERKVVQVAWLRSQEDIDRKKSRNHLSSWFKRLKG